MGEESELYFDVAAMATSAANIHALFQTFSDTLKQIDEYFDQYINSSDGLMIHTPVLGSNLNRIWHDLSLEQMSEYMARGSEWATVIKEAYLKNNEYSEEAEQIFNDLISMEIGEEPVNYDPATLGMETGAAIVAAALDFYSNKDVRDLTGKAVDCDADEYYTRKNALSEEVQQAIDVKNEADAKAFIESYERSYKKDKTWYYTALESYNPDVQAMVRKMNGDTDVNVKGGAR